MTATTFVVRSGNRFLQSARPPKGNVAAVCFAARASYRQVDHWCRTGLVGPRVRNATGSGTARIFDADEVLRVLVLAEVARIFGGHGPTFPDAIADAVPSLTVASAEPLVVSAEFATLTVDVPSLAEAARRFIAEQS